MALDGLRGPRQNLPCQGDDLQYGERGRPGRRVAHEHGLQLLSPTDPTARRPAVRVALQGLVCGNIAVFRIQSSKWARNDPALVDEHSRATQVAVT